MTGSVLLGCNGVRDANSGMAGSLVEIGAQLTERGWDVSFSFAPGSPLLPRRLDRQLEYVRVAARVRDRRPDVAIISSADGALLPVVAPRTPLVVQSHGLEISRREAAHRGEILGPRFGLGSRCVREPALRSAIAHAAATSVKTTAERDLIERRLRHRGPIRVIPDGVEDRFFTVERAPSCRPTFVWIGSWLPGKGTRELGGVLELVTLTVPDVELHVVGAQVDESVVRRAFADHVQRNLRVTERVDRQGVMEACSEAWLGVFTSWFEGFGKAVLEMAASGLPVITTDVGVAPDLIDERCGAVCRRGDVAGMAAAVAALLADPARAATQGAAARAAALPFTWSRTGDAWHELVTSVRLESDGHRT